MLLPASWQQEHFLYLSNIALGGGMSICITARAAFTTLHMWAPPTCIDRDATPG